MNTCPNCHAPVADGCRFCGACGALIPQEPVAPTKVPAPGDAKPAPTTCPNCGKTLPSGARFCQSCGAPIAAQAEPAAAQTEPAAAQAEPAAAQAEPIAAWTEAPTARTRDAAASAKNTIAAKVKAAGSRSSAEGTPKRKKPTAKIIGISAVAVVLVVAIILGITLIPGKHASNTAIYLKDGNLCVLPNVKKNTDLLTMQMFSDPDYLEGEISDLWDYQNFSEACSAYVATLSKDGSKYFYISITESNDEIRLCYIDLKAKNATPVRISGGDVLAYSVNESATLVTFLRDDNNLYQYDMQSGKAEKIASDLEEVFVASRDGSKIVYTTENGLYLYSSLGQTEKLSNDYCSQVYTPDDTLSTIYYVDEDDTLFCNKTGKAGDSFKIASGVDTLYGLTENGVYYTTDSKTITMYDYVNQDLLSVDPDSLERPEYPFSFEYDTDAEYRAAMEQYEADMEVYEHANDLRELQKDLAREQYTLVTLNYFNGSQSSVVAEDVRGISISYASSYAHAAAVLEYAYPDPEKAAALTMDDLEAIIGSTYTYAPTYIYDKICSSSAAGDVVRADVAAHAADGDLRPAVFRAGHGQGRAVLVGTEDGVVRARAGAHAHITALDRTVGAGRAAAVGRDARERDIVRVDIAGGAVVADLVPGTADAGDRHGRAGVVGAEDGAARARARAHAHVAAIDRAGAEAGIHFIGAFEVIGRYVADGAVIDHRGPAAARLRGHHNVGARRERGDNAVIRSGARSEVDGRRRSRAAVTRRRSRNGQRKREERGNNGCFQKSFRHRIILCLVIRERAVQPHSRHVHGVVQAVLFCLFDHTVAGFQIRVGELELHGDPRRHVEVLDLLRVEDLHHNDVLVGHAAVIEQVVFPAQRMAFVAQFGRFCCQ